MADPQWQRLKQLFVEAASLDAKERAAFIERECNGDAGLKARLELLLSDYEAAPDFLERPPPTGTDEFLEAARRVLRDAAAPPDPPEIPDHEVIQFIDGGTFGQTWLVTEKLTGCPYAVKVFSKEVLASQLELDGIQNFKERAADTPHLLTIEHVGETETHYYYVMELAADARGAGPHPLEGYEAFTLDRLLERRHVVPPREAIEITRQILVGLEALHGSGLLHRDIKPANILLGVDGRWKLGDLGLIQSQAAARSAVGTPPYTPPEGVKDRCDDLYAVGQVLAELVRGSRTGRDVPLPARIARTVARACHENAEHRFSRAAQMNEFLTSSRIPRIPLHHPIAIALFIGALILTVLWWDTRKNRPAAPGDVVFAPSTCGALLEVHFLKNAQDGTYGVLTEHDVPLVFGTMFQLHVALDRPGYTYLYYLTGDEPPLLLYPETTEEVTAVRDVYSPPLTEGTGPQRWHKVGPPAGTDLMLLLVSDAPLDELASLERLLAHVSIPALEPHAMLGGDLDHPILLRSTRRGIVPDSAVANKPRLQILDYAWRARFRETRVIAFPIVAEEKHSDEQPK